MSRVEIEQAIRGAHAAGWARADVEQLIATQPLSLVDGLLVNAVVLELYGLPYRQPAPGGPQALPDEEWVGNVFLDDLDADLASDLEGATKSGTAEALLAAILADGGWVESSEAKRLLSAAGYPERTAQRAARALGVESERRGFPSRTFWRVGATEGGGATEVGASGGATEGAASANGFGALAVAPSPRERGARRLRTRLATLVGTHRVRP